MNPNDKMIYDKAKELCKDHLDYILTITPLYIKDVVTKFFTDAFIHGYKHGHEDAKNGK